MKRAIIVLVLLAAGGAGGWFYYQRSNTQEISVNTSPVSRGDIVDAVGSTGTLGAVTTVQVGTQVSGIIQWLGADFNSIVKKDQVIAKLDPSLIQAALESSSAGLTQSRASLTRAQIELERQKILLQDSQQKYNRAKDLFDRQLTTQADIETAKTNLDSAQANLRSQEAAIKQSEAAVIQSEANVKNQQVNLDHTIITAPIDGIVTQRSVDVGQTVAASLNSPTLFILAADLTQMQMQANIDEADIGRIRPGQHVTFRVDAYPTEQFVGEVAQVRLNPLVVQNVTTYATIINVRNGDLKLKPGMTATLRVEVKKRTDVLRVPAAALRFRPTAEMFAALNQEVPPEAQAGRGRGGLAGGAAGGGGRNAGNAGAFGGRAQGGGGANQAAPAAATPGAAGTQGAAARGANAQPGQNAGAQPAGAGTRTGNRGGNAAVDGGAARGGNAPADGGATRGGTGGGRAGGNVGARGGQGGGNAANGRGGNIAGRGGQGGFGGGRNAGAPGDAANQGGGRGQGQQGQMDRFNAMSADQQQQFIAAMKGRGMDVSAYEKASKANSATVAAFAPKYGQVSSATIDALFAPLPPTPETAGRAWVYVDKQLKSVTLRLGLSDGTNTELVGGDVEQGAELVTGILGVGASRPVLGGNNPNANPLLGNQQRGGPPGGGGPPQGGGGRGR